MEEIVYYVNRRGAKRAVIVCLILLFVSLFLPFLTQLGGVHLSTASKVLAPIAGIGGIVCFGAIGFMFLRRLFSKEPYLVISARGIYDNASGSWSGSGWIEWGEITDVQLSKYQGLPCVELVPKNREHFLQRFGWLERFNRSAFGYPAVALRGPLLPVEPALLAEQIREYWLNSLDT